MKNFFISLWYSVTSVEYYRIVTLQSFFSSLRFYLLFLAFVSVLISLKFWIVTFPQLQAYVEKARAELVTEYPADLTIKWNGSQLSSSSDVLIRYPQNTPESITSLAPNLAVLTSNANPEIEDVLLMISPTQLILVNDGAQSSTELKNILGQEEFEVHSSTIEDQSQRAAAAVKTGLSISAFTAPLVVWLSLIVSRFYIMLIESLLIFILLRLQGLARSYTKVLQFALHIFVPAEVVNQLTQLAGLQSPVSMLSLSFWILFIFIFFTLNKGIFSSQKM